MPIDPLPVWKDEFEKLGVDSTGGDSPRKITEVIDQRVTGKLSIDPKVTLFVGGATFTWQKSIFLPLFKLATAIPSPEPVTPATAIAAAWAAATQASQLNILPGPMNPPPPGTGILASALAVIDPPSVLLGQAAIITKLVSAPPSPTPEGNVFPVAFREAFSKVTITITGLDTTTPTPIPFLFPLSPVV
jgi:hypothetical protein